MSQNKIYKPLLAVLVSLTLMAVSQTTFADTKKMSEAKNNTKLKPTQKQKAKLPLYERGPKLYFGASVGMSILKPKVKTASGRVADDKDFASKAYIGYNVTPHVAVELSHAVMGGAHVKIGARKVDVRYKMTGVSALFSKKLANRVNGFARVGYADISNKIVPAVSFKQKNNKVAFTGVGVEYIYSNRLSYKGEYEYYGKDAQMFTAGMQWRIK